MIGLFVVGLAVGIISGMVGVGGGIFLVPALHYLFKFSQHEAQGTSIAVLVPPIGIFAAFEYYRRGYVHLAVPLYIAIGFAAGAFAGAVLADQFSGVVLRRFFGLLLFFIAMQMVFSSEETRFQAILPTAAATGGVALLVWAERRLGVRPNLRYRLERWMCRHRSPASLDDKTEYHI